MSVEDLRQRFEKQPYLWAYPIGGAVLVVCSILWWFIVYLGPQHVFWSMVDNSLATPGVVIKTSQSQGVNSLQQLVHVDTAAGQAHSLTTLKQDGTTVKTEIVGTKDADYTRYIDIASNAKADTSKVLGVWAKSDNTQQSETQSSGHQLYAQSTLGIGLPLGSVPVAIGNLPPEQRTTLFRSMRDQKLYQPDYSSVKKEYKDGRLLYTYHVNIQALLYVSMMKDFARDLGLHELDSADPNSYRDTPTLTASITVDAYSHQLAAINFVRQGYSQTYESFGLPFHMMPPKSYISGEELQKRLSAIGQTKQ